MTDDEYPKSKGAGGQRGVDYQVNLLALFALRGLSRGNWKLATEHKLAGAFDDIVFQTEGNGDLLMQSKHKEDESTRVSEQDFLSGNNNEFALVKYFNSYLTCKDKFNANLLILCSYIGPKKEEDIFEEITNTDPLFQEVEHTYSLSDKNLTKVKKCLMEDPKYPNIQHFVDEFCKKLRFFQIGDDKMNESIDIHIENAEKLYQLKFNRTEFIKNMNEWFLAKNGFFLRNSHVRAFLYDSCSKNYSEELFKYDIHFRDYYNIGESNIINVIAGKNEFLKILKIHSTLTRKYKSKSNILLMNPVDEIETTEKMLDSFELLRFTIIFVSFCEIENYSRPFSKLVDILRKYRFKKAVILSKEPLGNDLLEIHINEDEINFTDLTDSCQKALLSKSVIFQGKSMTMKQLVKNSTDDLDSIINQKIITELLCDRKFDVGTIIRDLGDVQNYYMQRTFLIKKEDQLIELNELDMCKLEKNHQKFILISDGAGMGKTVILTKLSSLIKKAYPHLFLVRIDLNMFTKIFKQYQEAEKQTIGLEDILKSKGIEFSEDSFEFNIFCMSDEVVLMVDAADEISPDYTSLVMNFLMQTSKRKNIFKIFVTTRPHLSMDLELCLGIKSYRMKPYSKLEQITFLVKFWKEKLNINDSSKQSKCEAYAATLIDRIGEAIGNTSWNFIGTPLQTRMIAEIFECSTAKNNEWICCREYLESENDGLKLPDKLNITKLYDMFVEKKGKIFIDDKCYTEGNIPAKEIIAKHYEAAINEHHKSAARLLFKPNECSLLNIFRYHNITSKETIIKMGMIQEFGDELLFVHQTFAEYFVAKFLWAQLNKLEDSENFLIFFLSTVLIRRGFEVVRAFLESILINESDSIREEIHQACSTTVDAIVWDEMKNINVLCEEGRRHILKLILDRSENSKDVFESTASWRSILIRLWSRIRKKEKLLNIVDKETGKTVLSAAVKYPEIVNFLLTKGADINKMDKKRRTVLHHAASSNIDLVKTLVEKGADINVRDETGSTALISIINSSRDEALPLFHYLLKHGADVNVKTKETTAVISAVLKQNFEMVEELTKRSANIQERGENGETALHWAAFKGHIKILAHLLKLGAKVNDQDNYGDTPGHYAVEKYNLDCLKLLVNKRADVNIKNKNGQNLLEYAISVKADEIVDFLIS